MKLLVVDDSNIIRMAITRYLSPLNLELIGTAANGVEALDLFREHSPDIVTMDITMPEMDGLECLTEMIRLKPDTKILMVTALKDTHTGIKALKLGAKGYLPKPFKSAQLIEEIEAILEEGE